MRQTPEPWREVELDTTVVLLVSSGALRVEVPDVVGLSRGRADAELREAGLVADVRTNTSSLRPGTVLEQSPAAGSSARERQVIRLEVSGGPALVTVPDVVGLDEASARQELQAAGFSVRVLREETSEPSEDGLVVAQRPLGGSSAESGVPVTITVAVFV